MSLALSEVISILHNRLSPASLSIDHREVTTKFNYRRRSLGRSGEWEAVTSHSQLPDEILSFTLN
jgi:hypothetical protein